MSSFKGKLSQIEMIEAQLRYEKAAGVHTYTMCDCGRKSCRRYKCTSCLEVELDELKSSQNTEKENK